MNHSRFFRDLPVVAVLAVVYFVAGKVGLRLAVPTDPVETLLVEDNPANLELTLRALCRNHMPNQIQVTRDGEEALDYLFGRGAYIDRVSERPLKLVLPDLKLPKVDGLEVLRALKRDPRMKVIPVVIRTSSREEKDLVSSYNLGVKRYIQKPVDFEQVRRPSSNFISAGCL